MNAISPDINFRNGPIIYKLKTISPEFIKLISFNCCVNDELTLELYAKLEIKIRPISMISLHIPLVDLSLLSKSFIPTCMIAPS